VLTLRPDDANLFIAGDSGASVKERVPEGRPVAYSTFSVVPDPWPRRL
jgi:hypothetical protein